MLGKLCASWQGGALRLRQVRNSVAFSLSLCEENVLKIYY